MEPRVRERTLYMPGTILENLSNRKIFCLVSLFLAVQLSCFCIGAFFSPTPAGSQGILASVCLDNDTETKDENKWFSPKTCKRVDLSEPYMHGVMDPDKLVFAVPMPLYGQDFSRWQQNLIGILQLEMVSVGQTFMKPTTEVTFDVRLGYRNSGDQSNTWNLFAKAKEKRTLHCVPTRKQYQDQVPYDCSTIPLFELGTLHHDYYLLNLRIPVDKNGTNADLGHITDLYLQIIHMNGGFIKLLVFLKTAFFPVVVAVMIWFWRRIQMLSRAPVLLEYLIMGVGCTVSVLNFPLEYFTLFLNMPFMSLLSDIRHGVFYASLMCFWLVFTGEHMLINESGQKNTLKSYWKHLSIIIIMCASLLFFDLCERGTQLVNPFFSVWVTPFTTNFALFLIIIAGISAGLYFLFLCYMVWKVFRNIGIKRTSLPSMSRARRLHYEGIFYRFNFLMIVTLVVAAITVISLVMSQFSETQFHWNEHLDFEMSGALYAGVYGVWNVYIIAMLTLYAPSHKQYLTDEPGVYVSPEEMEFPMTSDLPEPRPTEISSLTAFMTKSSVD